MQDVTIDINNFDLIDGVYITIAKDRDGNDGILIFISNYVVE